jgi:hypothetical protein
VAELGEALSEAVSKLREVDSHEATFQGKAKLGEWNKYKYGYASSGIKHAKVESVERIMHKWGE